MYVYKNIAGAPSAVLTYIKSFVVARTRKIASVYSKLHLATLAQFHSQEILHLAIVITSSKVHICWNSNLGFTSSYTGILVAEESKNHNK